MKFIGIDEAGRSPVIGDMISAGVLVHSAWQIHKLKKIGVQDSKALTEKQRSDLLIEINRVVDSWEAFNSTPAAIDEAVSKHQLNSLLLARIVDLIGKLSQYMAPNIVWVHRITKAGLPRGAENDIRDWLDPYVKLHVLKNEDDHPLVAAASIVATHLRTQYMHDLALKYPDIGSGEPFDKRTRLFLENCKGNYPEFVRKSWITVRRLNNGS